MARDGGCGGGESAVVVFARPKSSTLRWFAVGDEKVRGLDVAMDDAAAMRGVERVSNLPGEIESRAGSAIGPASISCRTVLPSSRSMAMNG